MSSHNQSTSDEYALSTATDRDRLYVQFDIFGDRFRLAFRRALALAGVATDGPWRALDVACGEGLYAADLVQRHDAATVVGFDRDGEAISTARVAFGDRPRLSFHRADVHDPLAPVVGKDFDVAYLQLGLGHFKFGAVALRQLCDVIRPGGAIMLLDSAEACFDFPNPSAKVLADALRAAWPQFGTYAAGDMHAKMLAEAGFVGITTEPQDYPLAGRSAIGQANFKNLIELLSSIRTALVERCRTISASDFDRHFANLSGANDGQLEGMSWFQLTIARKPD